MKLFWTIITVGMFGLLAIWSGCEDPNPIVIFEDSLTFEERLAFEEDSINQFIQEEGYDSVFVTESGLRIVPLEPGNGTETEFGDILSVDYTGSLLNGPVFDTTDEEVAEEAGFRTDGITYVPFVTNLGDDGIIDGWTEGLALMEEEQRVLLLIPSHLGYGIRGFFPTIGPFRILKFDMRIVRIRR